MRSKIASSLLALSLSFAPSAFAQDAAQAPAQGTQQAAPAPNDNVALTENFGDWTVRCFKIKGAAPCDVLQLAANKDTKQRVLSLSIAYVPSRDSYGMQIIVPLGIALAKGVTLEAGDKTLTSIKYTRCERDGCYVEVLAPDTTLAEMANMPKTTLNIFGYGKTEAAKLPLSLNGFGTALNRMKQLARERAVTPPAQTPPG